MSKPSKISPLLIVTAILALSIGVFTQIAGNSQVEMPKFSKLIMLPEAKPLEDAPFIDHRGQPYGLQNMLGKWSIVFFGFTNCPDICPTTMRTLSAVKEKVSAAGSWDNYQVIMVSVDPERDTTERLANYVPYFDSEFIGLSSDVDSTTAFAKQLGILFVKRDEESASKGSGEFYQVDHSASIILINPQGQWAGAITAPHKTDEISDDLVKLAQYTEQVASTASGNALSNHEPQDGRSQSNPTSGNAKTAAQINDFATQSALTINDAWIRPAPPNASSMAAYFELTNHSDADITIVDAQSDAFGHSMIHNTKVVDGLASMQHLDELVVPANSQIVLAPLGLHVMLMNPQAPLAKGAQADVVLTSANGKAYTFTIEVREKPKQP